MGVQERRAREKEGLRREILDAARELFVTEGYDRVTMRRLAEKIEYSPTTIYLYFKDKEELLQTVCEEAFHLLLEKQAGLREHGPPDPVDRLRLCLLGYCEFGVTHPHHYKLTFVDPIPKDVPLPADWFLDPDDPGIRTYNGLREFVVECINAGRLVQQDPELITQTMWLTMHGIVSGLNSHTECGFPFVDRQALINTAVDLLIRGFSRPETHTAVSR